MYKPTAIRNLIAEIDSWALNDPDRTCYFGFNGSLTYTDLKIDSDTLSVWIDRNSPAKKPVAVYGGLEYQMLVCFLACTKSGRPYIPIDRHTPKERIRAILEIADCSFILEGGEATLADDFDNVCSCAKVKQICEQHSGCSLPVQNAVSGADTYYTIFTSGTTGGLKKAPKGVMVSHDNLLSFTKWILSDFDIPMGSMWLAQAPFSFDLSVMNIYPALASGGGLVPMERELTDDFASLFLVLPMLDINVWVSTPSFADICLMEPTFNEKTNPWITHFLFCGEELLHETARKLHERFPSSFIHNLYGPTETTVAVTDVPITPDILAKNDRLPVGFPKSGTEIFIADESSAPLPDGEQGEIIISGTSVAKGYLNNPEATDAAFFAFQGKPAYRTGDAGILNDGLLYFKGRLDFQVKIHGYRVELEDIEHYLSQLPHVQAAAVVPKYQEHKVQSLIAFVVPANPNEEYLNDENFHSLKGKSDFALTKTIKAELRKTVMEYMVPQKIVYVHKLPLSQNDKINRRHLINEVNA